MEQKFRNIENKNKEKVEEDDRQALQKIKIQHQKDLEMMKKLKIQIPQVKRDDALRKETFDFAKINETPKDMVSNDAKKCENKSEIVFKADPFNVIATAKRKMKTDLEASSFQSQEQKVEKRSESRDVDEDRNRKSENRQERLDRQESENGKERNDKEINTDFVTVMK